MPSLFGALDTAVSGLTAQSVAFGNISDNVANSQTVGFKRTDTAFADYLSTSNAVTNDSGAVIARPLYQNESEGTVAASTNPLALAITGQGFFQVNQLAGTGTTATLGATTEYTRQGDFTVDRTGYLVNGSNQVLNGWLADPVTGVVNKATQAPIKISQAGFPPVATANVTLTANLPATPAAGAATSTQVSVYDAKGTLHTVNLAFAQNVLAGVVQPNDWTVTLTAPDAATPALGAAEILYGATTSGTTVPPGTIGTLTSNGVQAVSAGAAGTPATITFQADFGEGLQTVNLQLGNFGATQGLTQFAGTTYQPQGLSQDGIPPGNYNGVSTQSNGNVVVSYDNGQTKVVAQVPLAQFANANALQRQNGQAYTATTESGTPELEDVTAGGAGALVAGSEEGSNVDIASEFTKLIVTQQAYAANSKVVTTANDLMTTTIDMKR